MKSKENLYIWMIRTTSMLSIVSSRAVLMHLKAHLRFQVGSIKRKVTRIMLGISGPHRKLDQINPKGEAVRFDNTKNYRA
jgi:hypothetical protein